MAERGFGVKEINLIGSSGTPTIESPNNLNLNAVKVAISTNVSIGNSLIVTGISTFTGNIDANGDLDVDGHTNLDNVSVSGVTTFTGQANLNGHVNIGNVTNDTVSFVAAVDSDITPDATNNNRDLGNTVQKWQEVHAVTYYGSGANLTNLPASTPTTSDIQIVYEITNQTSFSYYRFAGNGVDSSANNPDIYLERGQKYRFINNSGGSHPFQIQTIASSPYTTGVTYPSGTSATSGNIDFAVRWDAPAQLKYVCTSHGSMVGNIYLRGAGGNETNVGIITATRFSGNGSSLTNLPAGNLTGTVADARISTLTASKLSGALPAISGANLTNLPAGNLTGILPAISGANLTNLPSQLSTSNMANNRIVTSSGGVVFNGESALTFDGSTLSIGAGTATPLNISSGTYGSFTASAGTTVTADSTAIGSASVIEYTIYISNSTNIQSQKVLIMDNGTTAYISEFAVMSNPNLIVTFTADVSSGNVRLRATPETGISGPTTIKFTKMIIE